MSTDDYPDNLSNASLTELKIFSVLSNPTKVDIEQDRLDRVKANILARLNPPMTPQALPILTPKRSPTPQQQPQMNLYDDETNNGFFAQTADLRSHESPSPRAESHQTYPTPRRSPSIFAEQVRRQLESQHKPSYHHTPTTTSSYTYSPPPPFKASNPFTDPIPETGAPRITEDEEEKRTKQALLIELEKLRRKGIQTSRTFTMADPLYDIQFELDSHVNNEHTKNTVGTIREVLRMFLFSIEAGNNRFGPFLDIDGWSATVTQDMHKFDAPVEKIYKRYWRRTSTNPFVEIAWLIFGSMIAFHFQKKFFGKAADFMFSKKPTSTTTPAPAAFQPQYATPKPPTHNTNKTQAKPPPASTNPDIPTVQRTKRKPLARPIL